MLNVSSQRRIWLCTQATDMRRSYDGLSALVRNHLQEDPLSGHWYVFLNRRRTQLKLLAFDSGGYCVWSKRLEQGQFAGPGRSSDPKHPLSATEFLALLEGFELLIQKRRKRYEIGSRMAA